MAKPRTPSSPRDSVHAATRRRRRSLRRTVLPRHGLVARTIAPRALSSAGRALPLQGSGRGFESRSAHVSRSQRHVPPYSSVVGPDDREATGYAAEVVVLVSGGRRGDRAGAGPVRTGGRRRGRAAAHAGGAGMAVAVVPAAPARRSAARRSRCPTPAAALPGLPSDSRPCRAFAGAARCPISAAGRSPAPALPDAAAWPSRRSSCPRSRT